MRVKWLLILFFALLLLTAQVGCGKEEAVDEVVDEGETADAPREPVKDAKLVYLITSMGGIKDSPFNELAWVGLDQFADDYKHWSVSLIESSSTEDYAPNLLRAAETGPDMIWVIGYMIAGELDTAAAENPDLKFGIVDWAGDEMRENVVYVLFKEHEGSFLVGLVAGMMTENDSVGFVGGMEGAQIEKFEVGFRAGVHAVNPEAEVLVEYAQSWIDPDKGRQITLEMIEEGTDIIYHAAGGTGIGVAEACREAGAWFIGVDQDQSNLAPGNTLTSMLKRVDNAVYAVSVAKEEGRFPGGETLALGLADGGLDYVRSEHLTAGVIGIVDEYSERIADGEIEVPHNAERLVSFMQGE